MRDAYHEALDAITDELVTMSGLVGSMMQQASTALLNADRELAESVIEADDEIDSINAGDRGRRATELIALQAAGRHGPPHGHRGVCASPPRWSAWATSPSTSPRPPGCATPTPRSRPLGRAEQFREMAADRRPHGRQDGSRCSRPRRTSSWPGELEVDDDRMDALCTARCSTSCSRPTPPAL